MAKGELVHLIHIISTLGVVSSSSGELIKVSNCTCPGDVIVYNCHVNGIGFTIWRGSAFECINLENQILLRHSSFGNDGAMGSCTNGAIVGRSLGVSADGLVYSSQLRVDLSLRPDLIGRTVQCVYRNSGITIVDAVIGSSTIQLTDPLPPPATTQLLNAGPQQLTFNWTSAQPTCPTVQYRTVSDCGACNDSLITQTSLTCAVDQPTTDERVCQFSIKSVICGNRTGVQSTPFEVKLKVPESPAISSIIPHYNSTDNKLTTLDIEFLKVESFILSNGVDGSASNYTVSYVDSSTNTICESLIISASSCVRSVCTVPTLKPLPCSQNFNNGLEVIDITISATNILGRGPSSLFSIDAVNHIVNITFESATRVVCIFSDLQTQVMASLTLSCDIVYGLCQQASGQTTMITGKPSSSLINTVVIDLPTSIQSSVNCYTVNASNGTFTVLIEGSTDMMTSTSECQNLSNIAAILTGVILAIVILFTATLAAIVIIFLLIRLHRIRTKATESDKVHLLEDYSDRGQMVSAHISFDLEDKPKELVQALGAFNNVNLQNITIGSNQQSKSVKKIYIECERDLTEAEKSSIERSNIGLSESLSVTCEATQVDYIRNDETDVNVEINVSIKHEPGTLLKVLEFIYSIEEWKHINITDIIVSRAQTGPFRRVTIKFLSEMNEEWKRKYNKHESEYEIL